MSNKVMQEITLLILNTNPFIKQDIISSTASYILFKILILISTVYVLLILLTIYIYSCLFHSLSLLISHYMNKTIHGFCPKGRAAQKLCSNQFCKTTSLMCSHSSCDCNNIHEDCGTTFAFPLLTKKMSVKGMSLLPLKQSLIQWCKQQIKPFNRLIEETQKSIDDSEWSLEGDEGRLYGLLKNQKYQDVTSDLVYRAVTNLLKDPKVDIKVKMDELEKKMKEAAVEIERALEKFGMSKVKMQEQKVQVQTINLSANSNSINSNSVNSKFSFSQVFHHGDIEVQGNSIVKTVDDNYDRLSLLQPALSLDAESERSRVKFRIVESQHRCIFFGVYELKGEKTRRFQMKDTNQDLGEDKAVLFANGGYIFSHLDKQKDMKQSQISEVLVGDVLEVSFQPKTKTVTFRNERSKETQTMTLKEKITHPLHYCVMLGYKDDKVEMIQ